VPYPDGSGRFLIDEVVEGTGWEALVSLGYVVKIADKPGKRLPVSKDLTPRAQRSRRSNKSASKNDILDATSDNGVIDVIDGRARADEMDQAPSRSTDTEDPIG
jgi:hypothetical protein